MRLSNEDIDAVFASPMRRARETAETIALPHGLGVSFDADLVELDWGSWTGRPLDDAMEREVSAIRRRWREGEVDVAPPLGESPSRARERAERFLSKLKATGALAPLVVAHGRFNRVLMTSILGAPLTSMDDIRQRNGSVSVFLSNDSGAFLGETLDDVAHLAGFESPATGSDSVR